MSRNPFLSQFFERRSHLVKPNCTLGTMTGSAGTHENPDTDEGPMLRSHDRNSPALLGTQTLTEAREAPDQDPSSFSSYGTQTMTKMKENGDTDAQIQGRGFLEASVL